MFDFKEIKKITSLFFKNNQKKIDNQKKNNNLDLEVIFNELIEEINTQFNKKHKVKNNNNSNNIIKLNIYNRMLITK